MNDPRLADSKIMARFSFPLVGIGNGAEGNASNIPDLRNFLDETIPAAVGNSHTETDASRLSRLASTTSAITRFSYREFAELCRMNKNDSLTRPGKSL